MCKFLVLYVPEIRFAKNCYNFFIIDCVLHKVMGRCLGNTEYAHVVCY